MRQKIRERILYLYQKYEKAIKAPTKLQRKIMTEYRAKWCRPGNSLVNGSRMEGKRLVKSTEKGGEA